LYSHNFVFFSGIFNLMACDFGCFACNEGK
jgi:hypothetical protein